MSDPLLEALIRDLPPDIPPRDVTHTRIQFSRGLDYYRVRVDAVEFAGLRRVLDAGCGCGQWSLALAERNDLVVGLDINPHLLYFARRARDLTATRNVYFQQGDLHYLPCATACFDAVFCYSVLMATREDRVFSELVRVLRPGGRLYICSDGPGWPLYKIFIQGLRQGCPRSILGAVKTTFLTTYHHTLRRRFTPAVTFLNRRDVETLCEANGIRLDYYGPDGSFHNPERQRFQPLYGETFWGLPADFEMLGTKGS